MGSANARAKREQVRHHRPSLNGRDKLGKLRNLFLAEAKRLPGFNSLSQWARHVLEAMTSHMGYDGSLVVGDGELAALCGMPLEEFDGYADELFKAGILTPA
jgi:hypothetical protein